MVAYNNSVNPAASTATRYYAACPERSRGNDQRVLLETDAAGTEYDVRYFVYGNYIDEVLVMHRFLPTPFDYYYDHDHLYSPAVVFGQGGAVLERYEYDAYGTVSIMSDLYVPRSFSNIGNPYTFTGRRLDMLDHDGTGQYPLKLMDYRARTCDPQTGRFLQRDPLGIDPAGATQNPFKTTGQYKDGMNVYEYVQSSPVNDLDPLGLAWTNRDFINHYFGRGFLNGEWLWPGTSVDLYEIGLLGTFQGATDVKAKVAEFRLLIKEQINQKIGQMRCGDSAAFPITRNTVTNVTREIFAVGHSTFFRAANCVLLSICRTPCCWSYSCTLSFGIKDAFTDPLDTGHDLPGGTPYGITTGWVEQMAGGCRIASPSKPDVPK